MVSEWGTAAEERKARKAQQARTADLVMEETAPAAQCRTALVLDLYCTAVRSPTATAGLPCSWCLLSKLMHIASAMPYQAGCERRHQMQEAKVLACSSKYLMI